MSKPSKKKAHSESLKRHRAAKLLQMGTNYHVARDVKNAEDCYRKVIDIQPLNFRALYLLGVLYADTGKYKDAVEFMLLAIKVNPKYSLVYNDLGVIKQQMGDVNGATECYKMALDLNGKFHEAQNNMGVAWQSKGNSKMAREHFKEALAINPYYFDAFNNYIFALDMSLDQTVSSLIEVRKEWSKTHELPLVSKQKPHDNKLTLDRKLRIGYVSGDFRLHSASFVFGSMIVNYDREKFEVYAYSNVHEEPDQRTREFKAAVTQWRDIHGVPDDDVAAIIRKDKIDILVDLSGFSAGSRLLVFARKPAPIQACAWGYATSTGMKSMDYFMADNVVVPPEERDLYVEKVVYLPNVVNYYSTEQKPEVGPLPALKEKIITFGSFNRVAKISDEALELWAKVMVAVPNSRMLVKLNELEPDNARLRIMAIMEKHGVNVKRLWYAGKTSLYDHLKAFNDVDIALDPFPHTGGLTSVDCLMMGVPVLTLKWPSIVGRLSASMLNTLDMNDWVAETSEDYVRIAVEKCQDLEKLAELRTGLRDKFYASPLGDCVGYCRAVEKEYETMWRDYVTTNT